MRNFPWKCYRFIRKMPRKRVSKLLLLAVMILPYVVALDDVYVTLVLNFIVK